MPLLTVVALFISGCGTLYPLPVKENNISEELEKNNKEYGLPIAKNIEEAKENIKNYADWYFIKSVELKEFQYKAGDTSLGFGIAGLIAGITKSPEGAAAGALLSSVSQMPSDRYHIAVQAANYEKASDTMHCLYRKIVQQDNTNSIPDKNYLNDRIYEVRRKLRKLQSNISLASPDITEMERSLKLTLEKREDTAYAKNNLKQAETKVAIAEEKRNTVSIKITELETSAKNTDNEQQGIPFLKSILVAKSEKKQTIQVLEFANEEKNSASKALDAAEKEQLKSDIDACITTFTS